jgi:RNA polymerase sigma-70 factor, ECF subfamily
MIARVVDGPADSLYGHLRDGGLIVIKTSVQWASSTLAREGARLQFTAFDASYLERLQRGDARTEQHFAAYFSELIRLKLRSRLNSKEAVEDVRQETFVRVLALVRAKDGIRQPERLGALVNSVCNHVLLEHYRSHSRIDSSIDEEPERAFIDEAINVSGLFEVDETERAVRKILSDLPERDRRLLQCVLLEERDKDEVCAELGLSREYLRVLVHRAKKSFKAIYMKRLGEPHDVGETRE